MIELIAKSELKTYTHSPTPGVVINKTNEYRENTSEVVKTIVTWDVTGIIIPGDGSSTILEQVEELVNFYSENQVDSLVLKDGLTVYEELPLGEPIRITDISFPEGTGSEWATKRSYSMTFTGVSYPADVTTEGDYSYTITYAYDQSGLCTRTVSCTLRDYVDNEARSKMDALVSSMSWLSSAGYTLASKSYVEDRDDTVCTFTCTLKQYWEAFPANITNAQLSSEVSIDSQGVTRRRFNGWFEGGEISCNNAISSLAPASGILISSSISRDDYGNKTNFALEYIVTTENDIIQEQYSLSIQSQTYDFVWKPVLGGGNPVKQNTAMTIAKASQSGTIKKLSSYATEPSPVYDTQYIKSKNVTRSSPEINTGSGHIFTTNYSYEFEFPTTPSWPA